jgi:hypothetical protein
MYLYPGIVQAVFESIWCAHENNQKFAYLWSRYLSPLLSGGRFKPHPYKLVPGGLNGVSTGLKNLRDQKASAVKFVYRVENTDLITS